MTVGVEHSKVSYLTNGVLTTFPITFDYDEGEQITVILRWIATGVETTLAETTHYIIDGLNIETLTAYETGYELHIIRDMSFLQTTDYREEEPLPSEVLEYDIDKVVKMIQMLEEKLGRTLLLPPTSGYTGLQLPEPENGYILQWQGGQLVNVLQASTTTISITAFMIDLLTKADAEEAQDHLGFVTPNDVPAGWHYVGAGGEPPFENGWSNSGGSYQLLAFMKDTDGVVHLKGRVQGGTPNTVIFTLPVGYRMSLKQRFIVPHKDGQRNILIDEDGKVWDERAEITYISDDDGDTAVYTEFSADEDVIRFYVAGTERGHLSASEMNLDVPLDPTSFVTTNGGFKDEDDMTSDSATAVSSQQAIKAFVEEAKTHIRVSKNDAQSISSGSTEKFELDDVEYDVLSEYDDTTNFRFTADEDGYYKIDFLGTMSAQSYDAGDLIQSYIYKNGAIESQYIREPTDPITAGYMVVPNSTTLYLDADDYIEIFLRHNAGANRNTDTNRVRNHLSIDRVGRD